jgi:TatD DNase family protein
MIQFHKTMVDFFNIHTHVSVHPESEILSLAPEELSTDNRSFYASVGIHPWTLTEENADIQWETLHESIKDKRIVAIGECGLDKLKGPSMELQTAVFKQEAALAEDSSLPLIIHCVKAFNELIQLKKEISPCQPWIIHGFRGKLPLALDCIRHGFYLSIGSHFQENTLKAIPLDRLFIETDESEESIGSIYQRIAETKGISQQELIEAINKNLREVFFKA